jgi:peptidyl-tRNA hydrolase
MKNITLSVDDETYRRARIVAAERDTSVSALVREYLQTLSGKAAAKTEAADELFAALDRAKDLRASERLSRDEAHAR